MGWLDIFTGGNEDEPAKTDYTMRNILEGNIKSTAKQNLQELQDTAPSTTGKTLLDLSQDWSKTDDFKNAERISKEKLEEAKQKAKEEGRQLTPEETRNIGGLLQYANDAWQKKLSPPSLKARGGKVKKKKKSKKGYSKKYANGGTIRKPRRA